MLLATPLPRDGKLRPTMMVIVSKFKMYISCSTGGLRKDYALTIYVYMRASMSSLLGSTSVYDSSSKIWENQKKKKKKKNV